MRLRWIPAALAAALVCFGPAAAQDDPYQWLEEVDGEKALEWVQARSALDQAELEAVPEFESIHEALLEIYNSRDRIPDVSLHGNRVYNFWQDAEHVRGIWRRTTLDEYVKEEPAWETVLDLDALAAAEGENWVWKDAEFLYPEDRLTLVSLSRGGGDAIVVREFDTAARAFVPGGFHLPEAKSQTSWKDENTIWIGTDFGEGSLTTSGYPRLAKEWKRGTPLESATTVFEGKPTDVSVSAYSYHTPEARYDAVRETPAFFRGTTHLNRDGELIRIDIPEDAEFRAMFRGRMLISLRTDWTPAGTTYPAGALLAVDLEAFLAGERGLDMLFEPESRVSLGRVARTRNQVLLSTLDNVHSRLYRLALDPDGAWSREEIGLPGLGTARLGSTSDHDDTFFFTYTDFLTPTGLYLVRDGGVPVRVKTSPEFFDATGMQVLQHEAPSPDGTLIPYFVVAPRGFEADGRNPTLLYGYGGFEVSMLPMYSGGTGSAWVSRGGVYVLANIRGGGEFGPAWHSAALKENRQICFDDFIAVAEDLVRRRITSSEYLGIAGGSNGGLLVGACFVQRPELFEAVVCQVPLLDMRRYNKLLAGASWMAEYGDPDTGDWEFIRSWSPYHNLDPAKDYPKVLFTTSTRDDRVHPGHARKMVAKMADMGKPVYYYENTEGGHSAAANNNQRAYMWALTYAYLWKTLRPAEVDP